MHQSIYVYYMKNFWLFVSVKYDTSEENAQ